MKKRSMKRKSVPRRARRQPLLSIPPQSETRSPEWVNEMRDCYRRTGLYRAGDLNRVLGDPREQVVGAPADDLLVSCGVYKS
jgi:hypothetical protein